MSNNCVHNSSLRTSDYNSTTRACVVDDDNASSDQDFRSIPAFTAEEEKREIESLSFAEQARVQSDLVGLTSLLESLQPPSQQESQSTKISNDAITSLEAQLHRLPRSDTEAYYAAAERCPDQISHKRKMIFLEANHNDVAAAAANLAEYWKVRVEVFGNEKAYLPMTLAGAMKDEKINLATRCVWQLLPRADTAGRPVLFFCPGRRNFVEYSAEQEMVSATHTSRFTDARLPIIDTLCTHAW